MSSSKKYILMRFYILLDFYLTTTDYDFTDVHVIVHVQRKLSCIYISMYVERLVEGLEGRGLRGGGKFFIYRFKVSGSLL